MNQHWNSKQYTENFSFVHQYGNDVADLIEMTDVSSILDLGCGNGALSKRFADQGLYVAGIDASEDMLAIARNTYPDITFLHGDATSFQLEQPVDVVFSNAVFHWIEKNRQQHMMQHVHNALKDNGQFVLEMGGYGNNRLIHEALDGAFTQHGLSYKMPFYFPTIGEYSVLLEESGFQVTHAFLFDRPTVLHGEDGLSDWIHMFINKPFEGVADSEKEELIEMAVSELKPVLYQDNHWYADYVRLRMRAIKQRKTR